MSGDGDDGAMLLANQVCFAVYATAHAFGRVYRPILEPLGLTYPQYLVLLVLWERDGRTVGEIGTALQLDSGTLTPLLKRLEAMGHVARRRAADDERRVGVHLTPAGRAMRDRARPVPAAILTAMGGDLDRLARLRSELEALRRSLLAAAPADEGPPSGQPL
jgi:MarR family transcriptional regulator, organic hydroperoxide resistance regulator